MPAAKKPPLSMEWDYLIISASNDAQSAAYRIQIELRERLGLIRDVKNILVVPDPVGRRIGSGGSTAYCLLRVLDLELSGRKAKGANLGTTAGVDVLDRLRILIVHAGGDSRRLPPYGPCGKIFVPVPGESGGALGTTLFDRLIPTYLRLPLSPSGGGQVVVAAGDVLLDFEAANISFSDRGITGIGALVSPEVAKNHGVYLHREDGIVRRFLQKPSVEKQERMGVIDSHGQSILDIGILSLNAETANRLLEMFALCQVKKGKRRLDWGGPLAEAAETAGLDLYREICCALGTDTGYKSYVDEVRSSGSVVKDGVLRTIYQGLRATPFNVHILPNIRFLHFGTLQDLLESGITLLSSETNDLDKRQGIIINSRIYEQGSIRGKNAWIEGCRIEAPLTLEGDNVVVGADIAEPLSLPRGACLDVIEGSDRKGRQGWFVRAYAIDDVLHNGADEGGRFCGLPILKWLEGMDANPNDVWERDCPPREWTVWSSRIFPFVKKREHARWLFCLEPGKATTTQKRAWFDADRYSLEEIALLADLDSFYSRRLQIRGDLVRESLPYIFGPEGELSAKDIAYLAGASERGGPEQWIVAILREAARRYGPARTHKGPDSLELPRILHMLGSVLQRIAGGVETKKPTSGRAITEALKARLTAEEKSHLSNLGLPIEKLDKLGSYASEMKETAFRELGQTIVTGSGVRPAPPRNVLRSDEIVWGRAPARLDLGGGWTDTPPYSLERGGCVINAAVNLNGQAPIQAYARIIEEREIRINSIDHSTRTVVRRLEELLDFKKPGSQFALAKAALALAGFSHEAAVWPRGVRSLDQMLRHFGGGIELTTLAAIPSGSGLGTSSIMGAVLMSIIGKVVGRPLASRELFHAVLKLEQELTTGGGWQDQIGGAVEGVKMITTDKGLVPDPQIHFVPADLLDPATNGGLTLLYYTGLRRLAKNILHEVVGRYLDRDRGTMETLRRLHAFPPEMVEAMAMKDPQRFGELIEVAWRLNVKLDPNHTTPIIEELRAKIRPHIWGAKLLGAGGGGFLLIVSKSPADAGIVKQTLEKGPPNDKARFFDYSLSRTGLIVTVC